MNRTVTLIISTLALIALLTIAAAPPPQADNPQPPDNVAKLVFIHHSTGQNWLTDGYGDLGRVLGENNYFVSDTNYGWGPDSIGDRTDIPNWTEWFASGNTPTYMDALFNETGQNSPYTRVLSDPGGENQIIMFKSCFPNSALKGRPDDPPGSYEDMTVSGAKYVYNTILQYFATRPDKLFIVITAPPLSKAKYADNARAFNNWLVNDWLRENNYTLNNVAVFDFYNILTASDAHHRYNNGQVEHIVGGGNTLYYPSGDDHPSEEGSRKATEEFVPMLNVFYHRWQANAPLQPVQEPASPTQAGAQPALPGASSATVGVLDDFEIDAPFGTGGWQPFWDEATTTSIRCAPEGGQARSGTRALLLDFDVAPSTWATCALFYDTPQDWSPGKGLTFYLHASQPDLVFDVDIYAGSHEAQETYLYTVETPPECASGWAPVSLNWTDFHRADWEENAGIPFNKPDQVVGLAFGFNTYENAIYTGQLWFDDLALLGVDSPPPAQPPAAQTSPDQPSSTTDQPGPGMPNLPCGVSLLLPLFAFGLLWAIRSRTG